MHAPVLALGLALFSATAANANPWNSRGQELVLSSSGPFFECEEVTLRVADGELPEGFAHTHKIQAGATYPYGHRRQVFLDGQEFVTPQNSTKWLINYPRGTVLDLQLSPWRFDQGNYYSGHMNATVQPGNSTSCIPASHKPIITAIPEIIQECEPAVFQVSGVKGPLQGYIWSSVEGSEMVNIIFDKDSFTWIPNYPVGTRIHINIWENAEVQVPDPHPRSNARVSLSFTVDALGYTKSCIPYKHSHPPRRHWYSEPPAIITWIVLGSVTAGGVVIYLLVRGYWLYQARKSGEIRLPAEV